MVVGAELVGAQTCQSLRVHADQGSVFANALHRFLVLWLSDEETFLAYHVATAHHVSYVHPRGVEADLHRAIEHEANFANRFVLLVKHVAFSHYNHVGCLHHQLVSVEADLAKHSVVQPDAFKLSFLFVLLFSGKVARDVLAHISFARSLLFVWTCRLMHWHRPLLNLTNRIRARVRLDLSRNHDFDRTLGERTNRISFFQNRWQFPRFGVNPVSHTLSKVNFIFRKLRANVFFGR